MQAVATPSAGSLRFELLGIPITILPSFWLVTLVLSSALGAPVGIAAWLVVVIVSIVAHELGHALLARRWGQQVRP